MRKKTLKQAGEGEREVFPFPQGPALEAAESIVSKLTVEEPAFTKMMICGSLRRQKGIVHDIDIVGIPHPFTPTLFGSLADLGAKNIGFRGENSHARTERTNKVLEFDMPLRVDGIERMLPCEIWYAGDERQFEVLKLIRTGGNDFNKRLTTAAIEKGMAIRFAYDPVFRMDLYGLYGASYFWKNDQFVTAVNPARLVAKTEDEIISALLGMAVPPEKRS